MIAKTKAIHDTKNLVGSLPAIRYVDPEYVYCAVTNARAAKADILVKEGDHVNCGQKIGVRHGPFFDQPIHSSVSGTYVGIEKHYHRNGKLTDFLKIKNDHLDTFDPSIRTRTPEEIAKLTKADITEIVKEQALVGLGGSSFPTYIKFQTDKKIDVVLINAIECEPYITADHRLMMEFPYRIVDGIKYAMQAFNCHHAKICIKSKYKDLKLLYTQLLKEYPDSGIELCCVGNYYPQGWEVAMIKEATGIELNPGELPSNRGIINFNVSTIVGLYKAVKYNMPVVKRFITITGDGIIYPKNFRVRVGTAIKDLLPLCGGYKNPDKDKVFILGGPMMGASVPNDDVIITKTVTSIIILDKTEYKENPCVRCGSCVLSCPTHLEPVQIMNAVKTLDKERIKKLNPLKCIECGLCTYSCTSKIQVTDYIRKAKMIAKL
ncbi:MAG: RnfABCDGE type electron transport complex subunit C [Erysipelotrichaceae bacterium]|nr:RnfABCDGE type electron transport complex subunit C [Erysipelotrichaceae bacterium]